ncbi:hypothetical protein JL720_16312 [Aureococcus anophagefferens]|nr:hypothetical protein JL720_16312 [Aureococcus anophagefferens]
MKRESAVAKMAAGAHNGLRILELGSGGGRDAVELARSRVGIDFVGEFFEASFFGEGEGGTFDGAFAVDSLKHVPWDLLEAALSKIRRSLTPGGSFVIAEARVARKKPKAADGDDGPDRFTLSRDGEYAEQRTWLEWREKLQKFFVLDKMADYRAAKESEIPNFKGFDLGHFSLVSADFGRAIISWNGLEASTTTPRTPRRRKKTFWAASWIAKASALDVPPPPNFVDTSRRDVDPADLDEPVAAPGAEDLSRIDDGPAPPPKKPLTHLERLRADLVCTSCDTDEPVRRKPWPDDDRRRSRRGEGPRHELAKRARTHGEPSLEECAEYLLEDGDFDISGDAEALASQAKAARKKARALGAGFGRGFLN